MARCENCQSDGATKVEGWCLVCKKGSGAVNLCASCASDPESTSIGRRCKGHFSARAVSSGPGGLVARQRIGKGRTSS